MTFSSKPLEHSISILDSLYVHIISPVLYPLPISSPYSSPLISLPQHSADSMASQDSFLDEEEDCW